MGIPYIMIAMKKLKSFIVRLTYDEHERLRVEAFERNISGAELIRQAIKVYIEMYTIEEEE